MNEIKQPEQFETPNWVKHFIDFICCKTQEEWEKKQKENDYKF